MKGSCRRCGSCCRELYLPVVVSTEKEVEFYKARGLPLSKGLNAVNLKIVCPHLKDNRCSIYSRRPDICREYPRNVPQRLRDQILDKDCGYRT